MNQLQLANKQLEERVQEGQQEELLPIIQRAHAFRGQVECVASQWHAFAEKESEREREREHKRTREKEKEKQKQRVNMYDCCLSLACTLQGFGVRLSEGSVCVVCVWCVW